MLLEGGPHFEKSQVFVVVLVVVPTIGTLIREARRSVCVTLVVADVKFSQGRTEAPSSEAKNELLSLPLKLSFPFYTPYQPPFTHLAKGNQYQTTSTS